jgi:putative ABC transport system ATP-binding protein
MARSTLEEREDHVLKGHAKTIPYRLTVERFRNRVNQVSGELSHYLGTKGMGHHWSVVESGPPVGSQPPVFGAGQTLGVTIELCDVVLGRGAGAADHGSVTAGISLVVPSGQSVALLSKPGNDATGLLDVIAGLARPRAGQVLVDGIAVDRLGRAELDRFHAGRGLISSRFPVLPSLSVTDNVLAPLLAGRVDAVMRDRAARLLHLTGGARLTGRVDRLPVEDQWRIMVARALVASPRLVLADDPASSLDPASAARVLDLLMDIHAMFGFTLVLTAVRLTTAVRCQRQVSLVDGIVIEDEITSGDDEWTRGRIDRIG